MTVAIDKATGKVLGQVLDENRALPGHVLPDRSLIFILTREGYRRIPFGSVRLEKVS